MSPVLNYDRGLLPFAARLAAAAMVAIGATVLLGWWLQSPLLVRIDAALPPMSLVTATGIVLAGAALGFGAHARTRLGPTVLALIAALIGAVSLGQYLFDIDLALDLGFDSGWLGEQRPALGRVAPATALGLLLGGAGIALLHLARRRQLAWLAPLLALTSGLIGLLALLAYLFHIELLLSSAPYARMAPLTAFALTLLGAGLWLHWFADPGHAARMRERAARRVLWSAAAALIGIALMCVFAGLAVLERQSEEQVRRWLGQALQSRVDVFHDTLRNAVASASAIATRPGIRRELVRLRDSRTSPGAVEFIDSALRSYLELGFDGVTLHDAHGREIVRAGRFVVSPALRAPLSMAPGAELLWGDGFVLHIRRVIKDTRGELGLLVTEQPLPLLARMLDNVGGLGASAEMMVCANSSGTIRCFPTRRRATTFSLPTRARGQLLPAAAALDSITGVSSGPFDPTGARVLAAFGPIPLTGLGMAISLNTDELYRSIVARVEYVAWLLAALVLAALTLLSRQLRALGQALAQATTRLDDTRAQLRARQGMFDALLHGTSDAVYLKDRDGRYLAINNAGARRLGCTPEEAIGHDDTALVDHHIALAAAESDRRVIDSGITETFEEIVPQHGGARSFVVTKTPYRDAADTVLGLIGIARDITEHQRAEDVVRALGQTDELTGLRNRGGFITLAQAEIGAAQRNGRGAFLLCLDLNGMRQINERYGRHEGDRALRDCADVLRRSFRESDVIGRLDDDEFAVLTTGESEDALDRVLGRLQLHVDEHNRSARRLYDLSLSIGSVRYDPLIHPSFDALLKDARMSMVRNRQTRRVAR